MHEVACAFISIPKVPLNYSAISVSPRSYVLKVVSEYLKSEDLLDNICRSK